MAGGRRREDVHDLAAHRPQVSCRVPDRRARGLAPFDAVQDAARGREADREGAMASTAWVGADRRRAGHPYLDRARRARALPDQPSQPHRLGHRRTDPPLRARLARIAHPCRRHQVRQHPRRRRVALRGQATGRQEPIRDSRAHRRTRPKRRGPLLGTALLHTVIDDHSRAAYVEICTDEKAVTAIGVMERAVAWFADRGVRVERVLSDNGSACKPCDWRDAVRRCRSCSHRGRGRDGGCSFRGARYSSGSVADTSGSVGRIASAAG